MSSESNQAHSAKTTESNYDCDCDSLCISIWVLEFVLFFPCLVAGKIWENEVNWIFNSGFFFFNPVPLTLFMGHE